MLRTLIWHWRVHLAVVAAAAVASAVLGGALVVGDSIRASLRALILERLGNVDALLVAPRMFREDLAADLPSAAPLIVAGGSVAHAGTGARASQASIFGVDARFGAAFGSPLPTRPLGRGGNTMNAAELPDLERRAGQLFPSAAINATLAQAVGAQVGDALLLSFPRFSRISRETLMGDKDPGAVVGALRVTVTAVLSDRGIGGFGLQARQASLPNVFVALPQLQRALEARAQVNAVVVARNTDGPVVDLDAALDRAATLEDRGLNLERFGGCLIVESRELVLHPDVEREVLDAARALGAPALPIQSYLANTMRSAERVLPYSMVAAFDPLPGEAWGTAALIDGSPAPRPSADGVLLNAWAADDLGVREGDSIEMRYFVVGAHEELREDRSQFRVEGVLAMAGLAVDRRLTPAYPGIENAHDITAWDPPFPVDLKRIRDKDEAYWDTYGAAPKAFVAAETGRRLWSTRFGSTTSVRVGPPAGMDLAALEVQLRSALLLRVKPAQAGLRFRPVREEGLRASLGATDFSGLFLAFSSFLIGSSALLVGLLFRLGVERRSAEIGLLLAVGYRVAALRRRLLGEGLILGGLGTLAGLGLAWGYAALLITGLRTLWRPAVGTSQLEVHVEPSTLALGGSIALGVATLAVYFAMRRLVRVAPQRLLAGSAVELAPAPARRSAGAWLGAGGLTAGLGLLVYTLAVGDQASPGLAFGTGALILVSCLILFSRWCRSARHRPLRGSLLGMALRNSAWNPGRSVLSVALVASACFVIVLVGAHQGKPESPSASRESGGGGFALVAESDVVLYQDLNRQQDLAELGFDPAERVLLRTTQTAALRLLAGDDTSCLNLYRPERPRILGLPEEFIRRGGFRFARSAALSPGVSSPWALLDQAIEPGVIPAIADANSAQYILHLSLGQDLPIENERGEPLRLRLVALLDHSVFQSELLISERDFVAHFPSRTGHAYFLIEAPNAQAAEVSRILEARLTPFGFDATSTADKLAAYRVVENTYLQTFQVLGGLGLLLGTLGLGVVLARNMAERRGELAVMRAFGFKRSHLARQVLAESAVLLLFGMGIGASAALAAAAPGLVARRVPWSALALTLALVLAVGLLSSVIAVRVALRAPLLPALKAER